jgi:uncharacterized protein
MAIWALMILSFTACNVASGLLHQRLFAGAFTWEPGWRTLALLPVALRRQAPLGASLRVGLLWATWHFPVKFNLFLDYGAMVASAVLATFTLKLLAISVVMTFFWAQAGQATILAIAMHGLSNEVARVGGLTEPLAWQSEVITELNLAAPSSWLSSPLSLSRSVAVGVICAPFPSR